MLTIDEDKPGNRLNDGKCDAKGRLWAGTFGQSTGGVAGVDPKKGSVFKIGPLSGLISRVFWNSGSQPPRGSVINEDGQNVMTEVFIYMTNMLTMYIFSILKHCN